MGSLFNITVIFYFYRFFPIFYFFFRVNTYTFKIQQ